MFIQKLTQTWRIAALLWLAIIAPPATASITSFNTWTLVEDPPHAGMSALINGPSQVTLSADGAIPAGTDIGYQSVNGSTVANSSSGYYFSASQDFHIAVDFDVTATNSVGFAAIGFGIGEDGAGANSAGIVLGLQNGAPTPFAGTARIADVTQAPIPLLGLAPTSSGRLFVSYDHALGNITFGVNSTPSSDIPTVTDNFGFLENPWNDDDLLVSFFLRSDAPAFLQGLSSGTVEATFSNFAVLDGSPLTAVPLPAAVWLLGAALGGLAVVGTRRKIR